VGELAREGPDQETDIKSAWHDRTARLRSISRTGLRIYCTPTQRSNGEYLEGHGSLIAEDNGVLGRPLRGIEAVSR